MDYEQEQVKIKEQEAKIEKTKRKIKDLQADLSKMTTNVNQMYGKLYASLMKSSNLTHHQIAELTLQHTKKDTEQSDKGDEEIALEESAEETLKEAV